MNWLAGIAALGIGTAAFVLRDAEAPEHPIKKRSIDVEAGPASVDPPAQSGRRSGPIESEVTFPSATPLAPASNEAESLSESGEASEEGRLWRERNLALLERELGLNAAQRLHIARVWQDRDAQVAAFHAEIRSLKVLWVWGHDRKAREILAASHARIAALLSLEQTQRFYEILESRALAEGISFEVTPEITVVR